MMIEAADHVYEPTSTPPARIVCAEVPDVTQTVEAAGPRLIWVTILTTTTHITDTTSIT